MKNNISRSNVILIKIMFKNSILKKHPPPEKNPRNKTKQQHQQKSKIPLNLP